MAGRRGVEVVAALVLGAALGTAGHLLANGVAATTPDVPVAEVLGRQVERLPVDAAVLASVLEVRAEGCGSVRTASATVIAGPSGPVVVTNAHVVAGATAVSVSAAGGPDVTVGVVGTVPRRDLAVLGPLPAELATVALDPGPLPSPGSPVVLAGHPDGVAELRRGHLSTLELRSGYGATSEVLVTDVGVEGGFSGGAVLDAEGRVVGVVAARDPRSGAGVAYPVSDVVGVEASSPLPAC